MRSIRAYRELQGLERASTRGLERRESSFLKRVIRAFLVSISYILDIQLVDTRANIYIVNNIKQFKKGTFRLFDEDISTIDRSTTLEAKSRGVI